MSNLVLEAVVREPEGEANACVIWMHGLGADGHDFSGIVSQLQLPDALKVRYIFPHAPVRPVTIHGGVPCRAWFDIFDLNRLEKEDTVGIAQSEQAIHSMIQQQVDAGIAPHRILLVGFSQGGAIALYTALQSSYRLAGAVGLSTYLPLTRHIAQSSRQDALPVFLAHGIYDPVLSVVLGKRSVSTVEQLGCCVEWHEYPMEHAVCDEEIMDLSRWMSRSGFKALG